MTAISSLKRMKTGSEMLPFTGRRTIFIGDRVTSKNQFGFKKQLSSSGKKFTFRSSTKIIHNKG